MLLFSEHSKYRTLQKKRTLFIAWQDSNPMAPDHIALTSTVRSTERRLGASELVPRLLLT
jgi:hypothetical protein